MKKITLVGNPNTGKTTFFNALSKSDNHVGNFHGVTNSISQIQINLNGTSAVLSDVPGLYSLSSLGQEEQVAIDYIYENPNDVYLVLLDSENLKRNLYLALCLMEKRYEIIFLINNMGGKRRIEEFDFLKKLEVKYYLINPKNKEDIEKLKKSLSEIDQQKLNDYFKIEYELPEKSKIIQNILKNSAINSEKAKYFVYDYFNNDFSNFKYLKLDYENQNKIKQLMSDGDVSLISSQRYNVINDVIKDYSGKKKNNTLDNILLNKYLALPIFLFIMLAIFFVTFNVVGPLFSNLFDFLIVEKLGLSLSCFLANISAPLWVQGLFSVGVFGGISAAISFLPQVVLLQLFIMLLEDSGYISRVAFIFDDFLSFFGLGGKAAYCIIMGLGCSTTATPTARIMEEEGAKVKTCSILSYMSCSAKLPIYLCLGGAVFFKNNIFVILFLYLLGIACGLFSAFLLNKTFYKSKNQSFILEMPSYRKIAPKRLLKNLYKNSKNFLLRVGGSLLVASVIMFFLSNFNAKFEYVETFGESILKTVASILSPIFIPLGFGKWQYVSALVSGIFAKEIVPASLEVLSGGNINLALGAGGILNIGRAGMLSFLVFCLLYLPCISTFIVQKQEIGKMRTYLLAIFEFFFAYLISSIVFLVSSLLYNLNKTSMICVALIALLFFFLLIILIRRKKKSENGCKFCLNCKQ